MNDKITGLEKAALITTGAAAAYKTLLWSLEASVDSTEQYIFWLRVLFALVSFAAFDLVLMAVIGRGWSWHAAVALGVASIVSGAIGLEVGHVVIWPALHAAPAITLAAFGLHLMLCRTTNDERRTTTNPRSRPSARPCRSISLARSCRQRYRPTSAPARPSCPISRMSRSRSRSACAPSTFVACSRWPVQSSRSRPRASN